MDPLPFSNSTSFHSDLLQAMSALAEGTKGMMAHDIPQLARTCAKVRLEVRRSAAKGVPDLARLGVVRSEPLSVGLFDQAATDRVYASIPAMIQLPPIQSPK